MSETLTRPLIDNPTPAEETLIERFEKLGEDQARADAFRAFAANGLPHRRMEAWKWSDFRARLSEIAVPKAKPRHGALVVENAAEIRFGPEGISLPDTLPDGVNVFLKDEPQDFGNAEEAPLGALAAALAGGHGADAVMIEVFDKVSRPLHLIFDGRSSETLMARIALVLREEAELDLIESHVGGAGFSNVLVEFGLQERAELRRTLLQSGTKDEAVAITGIGHLAARASFRQSALGFGAGVARIETRLDYSGEETRGEMNAAYLARDGYHVDFTSHVDHGAQSCVTEQLTKGGVSEGGRGVFQGKFLVPRETGQFTDANMQHHALLLEEGGEVFAKPELEIYADDVECAHGNTSGQLDADALFYMRQRGIPLAEARALLTEAFVAEALEQAHEGVREQLVELTRRFLQAEA